MLKKRRLTFKFVASGHGNCCLWRLHSIDLRLKVNQPVLRRQDHVLDCQIHIKILIRVPIHLSIRSLLQLPVLPIKRKRFQVFWGTVKDHLHRPSVYSIQRDLLRRRLTNPL